MDKAIEEIIFDSAKELRKQNKVKDKIIILLVVLMFLEAVFFYSGFIWYESQFEVVETYDTTDDIDINTEGENASIDYNNVEGNQYNDNATHNEGGVD